MITIEDTNNGKLWSKQEIAQLQELMKTDATLLEVCETLKRSPMTVLLRVRIVNGIDLYITQKEEESAFRKRKWEQYEDESLMKYFNNGYSISTLAQKFDRTSPGIVKRIQFLLERAGGMNATYQKLKKLKKI